MNKKLKLEELNRISIDEFKVASKLPVVIVLNNIRSLQNIGSVFRTADAFRCKEIWLQGITAKPPHRDIQKSALGATNSVTWRYLKTESEVFELAEKENIDLVAIEQTQNSTNLLDFSPESGKSYGLIFGNEVEGVSNEFIQKKIPCLEIPQHGTKHSLNITISAGIVIWEFYKKMGI
jgi:23S rRNA (guanosine2251-2'-O)-methyltransferase